MIRISYKYRFFLVIFLAIYSSIYLLGCTTLFKSPVELYELALNHPKYHVREKAFSKIDDQILLAEIAKSDNYFRYQSVSYLHNPLILSDVVLNAKDLDIAYRAINAITDQDIINKILLELPIDTRYYKIRILALEKSYDQQILSTNALNDPDDYVRLAAIANLDDQKTLSNIMQNEPYWEIRYRAIKRLDNDLINTKVLLNDDKSIIRFVALERVTDAKILAKVSLKDTDPTIREAAIKMLIDQDVLAKIAKIDTVTYNRILATAKLTKSTNANTLGKIAQNDVSPIVREVAVYKIADISILNNIVTSDNDSNVIVAAKKMRANYQTNLQVIESAVDLSYKEIRKIGYSELDDTLRRDDYPYIHFLVATGVDINRLNADGQSPLMYAVINSNLEMVKVLLIHNAIVSQINYEDKTALDIAIRLANNKDNYAAIEILKELIITMAKSKKCNIPQISYNRDKLVLKSGNKTAIFSIRNYRSREVEKLAKIDSFDQNQANTHNYIYNYTSLNLQIDLFQDICH